MIHRKRPDEWKSQFVLWPAMHAGIDEKIFEQNSVIAGREGRRYETGVTPGGERASDPTVLLGEQECNWPEEPPP
jgi:hypothetical protein